MGGIPTQQAKETPVAPHTLRDARTGEESICDRRGEHFVVELKTYDYWLCRSHIRGMGQCNTQVELPDSGLPPEQCPRCRQPFPWHGTMEI